MNQLKTIILPFILFFISIPIVYGNDLNHCNASKININNYEPAIFEPTNNLLRKAGQSEIYCGEKIIVYGRVVDQNCVPVSDATIYAWQVNCDGKYPYKLLKTLVDKKLINIDNENSTFTGNGTATTNNKGEFHFITIYPAAAAGKDPHVNIRVNHHRLGSLQTVLNLKGKKVNNPKSNPELNSMSSITEDNGISIYKFDIVVPGDGLKSY